MDNPLIVLGCPRSGTTLLSRLISLSCYGEPFETHYILDYYNKLDTYGDITQLKNFSRLVKDICQERPIMQWNLEINPEDFFREFDTVSYPDIVCGIGAKIAEKQGKSKWGEKTPHYLFDLDKLAELFPESRFIYIVRDGRDVALSLLERPWQPYNLLTCAELWRDINSHNPLMDKLKAEDRLYSLRYEDLLKDPEKLIPEIYEFIGEKPDSAEVSELMSSIKRNNFYKWQNKMSPGRIKLFETCAGNTLKRFGYETSFPEKTINPFIKMLYHLHEKFFVIRWLFIVNVIDGIKIKFFGKQPFAE